MDAMASRTSHTLTKYISRTANKEAFAINFFAADELQGEVLWIYLPVELVWEVLRTMRSKKLCGYIAMPMGPIAQRVRRMGSLFTLPYALMPHAVRNREKIGRAHV